MTAHDALAVLQQRVSSSRLQERDVEEACLQNIFRAALRAADHGALRPWRFLVIRGQARQRLGDLFADVTHSTNPDAGDKRLDKARGKALRAPVIVVAISSPRPHPKVPVFEQELSTAAAVQNMLNAAFAQQVGAIWRTGPMAEAGIVREGLGVAGRERIIGFLYLGYPDGPQRTAPDLDVSAFFQEW